MKLPLVVLLIFGLFSPLAAQQGDIKVFVRSGDTEVFLNDCAAVERMDPREKAAPVKDAPGLSFCFGYIAALVDNRNTLNAASSKSGYCVPDSATISQLAKVVVKYGKDHPEELNLPAIIVVTNALAQSFPCQ